MDRSSGSVGMLPAQIFFLVFVGVNSMIAVAAMSTYAVTIRIFESVGKGEEIFMSIKDDCRQYNPKKRDEFLDPEDDSPKSISIRLFMGIVRSTEYQLTLGINVFTVTI